MLLSGSTLQTHQKYDFDQYSHRVPFVISGPNIFLITIGLVVKKPGVSPLVQRKHKNIV